MLKVSAIGMLLLLALSSSLCYAEVFFREDFEDGGKNWEFLGDVEVSTDLAHSGSKSVFVPDSNVHVTKESANLRVEIPDVEILHDLVWMYMDSDGFSGNWVYPNTWRRVSHHMGRYKSSVLVCWSIGIPWN